jgi:hypothetical protein
VAFDAAEAAGRNLEFGEAMLELERWLGRGA